MKKLNVSFANITVEMLSMILMIINSFARHAIVSDYHCTDCDRIYCTVTIDRTSYLYGKASTRDFNELRAILKHIHTALKTELIKCSYDFAVMTVAYRDNKDLYRCYTTSYTVDYSSGNTDEFTRSIRLR